MLVIWFYFILFFGVISSFLFCELIDRIRVTSYLSKTIVVIRSRMVAWCVAPILVLWIYFKLFIMHSVKYIYVASLWHLHLVFFFFFLWRIYCFQVSDQWWFAPGHGDWCTCLEKYTLCQDGIFHKVRAIQT